MFNVDQALTVSGDNPMNEDALGWTLRSAWVIDGATPLGEPYTVGGLSSATWFAAHIADSFRTLSGEADAVMTARQVMMRSQAEAARRLIVAGLADAALPPSASAAYVAVVDGEIDVAVVGDVEVLVTRKDGTIDALATNLPDALVATDAGLEHWGAIKDQYKQRRAILNDRGFSHVLTLAPLRSSAVMTRTMYVSDVQRVLLVSDGFTRLRDLGRQDTLIAMARGEITVAQATTALREAEHQLTANPPEKTSDDATAVMLSFPLLPSRSSR